MSKQELLDALKSETTMAEYLEVRDDSETISDIRSIMPHGFSRRDYFAAAALTGICANSYTPWSPNVADIDDSQIAKAALDLADALIAASRQSEARE